MTIWSMIDVSARRLAVYYRRQMPIAKVALLVD